MLASNLTGYAKVVLTIDFGLGATSLCSTVYLPHKTELIALYTKDTPHMAHRWAKDGGGDLEKGIIIHTSTKTRSPLTQTVAS